MKYKKYIMAFGMLVMIKMISALNLTTQLVDVNDTSDGLNSTALLPSIYYGTMNFFSQSLNPIIIIGYVLFFAFIIIAIGLLIKAIFVKVGDLAK